MVEYFTGEVQNIKDNNFAIESIWFNNKFKKFPENFNKGSLVKVGFTKKGNTNYWQTIEILENPVKEIKETKEIKPLDSRMSDSTINTLIMTIKDIYIALLNKDKQVSLASVTSDVINSYDKIIS